MKTSNRLLTFLFTFSFVGLIAGCKASHAAPTYQGREEAAEWRQKAVERIENIRKADLAVQVVDKKGNPLSAAEVKVVMKRHAFAFGSAVTAHDLIDDSTDGKRYREIVERSFNKVVFENDLKWGPWEAAAKRKKGEFYNLDNTFSALKWLRERDIAVRGHYVAWGPLAGDSGTISHAEKDGKEFRNVLLRHAEDKVRQVGDLVTEWDVVNHPVGWGKKTIKDIAGEDIYDVAFQKTQEWNPHPLRYINEGGVLRNSGREQINADYFKLIDKLLSRGVPVQGIGFMGHFFAEKDLTPPERLTEILDRYAALGLPLQITEFDVRYGSSGKWGEFIQLTSEQEQLQADYTRDFLIAMYSHPAVVGVVMWGFWEGRHWYPSAALYRKDWSVKPNGRVWEDLVLKKWWTNVSGKTDAKGRFATRGFLGDYEIEVTYQGRTKTLPVSLGKTGQAVDIIF